MTLLVVVLLAGLMWGALVWGLLRHRAYLSLNTWPPNPTLRVAWWMWLAGLALVTPLVTFTIDIDMWRLTALNYLQNEPTVSTTYFYLPIFAQALAAIMLPFAWLGVLTPLVSSYCVHVPLLLCYAYFPPLMRRLLPNDAAIAPVAVVMAPFVVFTLFWGQTSLVMAFLFVAALAAARSKRLFWAGLLAGLSCFKLMMLPATFVLMEFLAWRMGRKQTLPFVLGGLVSLVPSLWAFTLDSSVLVGMLQGAGTPPVNAGIVVNNHLLHLLVEGRPWLEAGYAAYRVWAALMIVMMVAAVLLMRARRITLVQGTALASAGVVLFSLEPMRMEALLALLWLDAVHRRDLRAQAWTLGIGATQALMSFPQYFTFSPTLDYVAGLNVDALTSLFDQLRGLVVGGTVIGALLTSLTARRKPEWWNAESLQGTMPPAGARAEDAALAQLRA